MMGNVARARGEAAKEILALLSERTLSTDDIAKALKIANGSARYHLTIMLKARSIHIEHWERRTYRMNPMRVFAIGDGEDAPIPIEWKGKKLHEVMTPVRDEITAALFGAVSPRPLGEYVSHLYKQFA